MTSRAGPSGRQPPSITTWSAFTSGTGLIRSKSPKAILSLFKPHLTERQKLELTTMQEVWFFTLDGEGSSRGGVKNGEFDDDDNNYILVQNEHFYYRFQLDRKIGQGGQSVVVRCLDHKTRTMVALKILASPSTSREEKHQRTELLMSMELQSDRSNVDYNVVRVLETFYFRGHKCLVMELLKAKLHCVLRQMTLWQSHEDAVRSYTRAILHFLAHTKSRGIVHGDIKPSNVLLANIADGIVRVRNFASSFFVDGKTSHVGGTLAYVAPEVLLGYPATCAVDTWSLGCTVAKLATDRELFLSFSRDDHLACCIEVTGEPPWGASSDDLAHSQPVTQPVTQSPNPVSQSPNQPPNHPPTHLPTHLPTHPLTHLHIYPPTHLPTYPHTHPPTYPATHLPTHPRNHPLTHLPTYPPTHSSTYPPTRPPPHPPTYPLTHPPTH
ncbi:dual specificity tyrosine-phosphorylation-regulated kinase 3-like [Petromyzon marinus]|uniref:dual specificity tyrosine-phosphorylation-regulated kinase 3-like n=1 Tax=Petromyzon marinus TaxID=7757 RepID=UPI003F72FC58